MLTVKQILNDISKFFFVLPLILFKYLYNNGGDFIMELLYKYLIYYYPNKSEEILSMLNMLDEDTIIF